MTGRMIEALEKIFLLESPDFVMVYGDTNSTLAGSVAAKKMGIRVIHVEAGLRSFDIKMPEEINRILTDRISDVLFCPTDAAVRNLINEGFDRFPVKIFKTGDVMQDAAIFYSEIARDRSTIISQLGLSSKNYYLCTLHRAENTNDLLRVKEIVSGLNSVSEQFRIVLPVHPRTKELLKGFSLSSSISIIDPVGYFDMLELIRNSRLVITDSGGLQKEAYFFDKFCVTVRDQTEWVELVEGGFNKVVGCNSSNIVSAVMSFERLAFTKGVDLYGGGIASSLIANSIIDAFYDFN
jgi:UDP-GlcNAc3NAcA epimerase